MTTCLAAICDYGRAIVTVADTKLSLGFTGGHGQKMHLVHRNWLLLYAADDSGACREVIEQVYRKVDAHPLSSAALRFFLQIACAQHPCAPDTSRSFILAGFEDNHAQLWEVADTAELAHHASSSRRDLGYSAIGSGGWVALHMLPLYQQSPSSTIEETVYACCATKFFTEQAEGVGADTVVYIFRPGEIDSVRVQSLIPQIRQVPVASAASMTSLMYVPAAVNSLASSSGAKRRSRFR